MIFILFILSKPKGRLGIMVIAGKQISDVTIFFFVFYSEFILKAFITVPLFFKSQFSRRENLNKGITND